MSRAGPTWISIGEVRLIPNDAKVSHWRLWPSLIGTIACFAWGGSEWYISASVYGYLIALVACIVVSTALKWLLILLSSAFFCGSLFYALLGPGGIGDMMSLSLFYAPSIVLLVYESFGPKSAAKESDGNTGELPESRTGWIVVLIAIWLCAGLIVQQVNR